MSDRKRFLSKDRNGRGKVPIVLHLDAGVASAVQQVITLNLRARHVSRRSARKEGRV